MCNKHFGILFRSYLIRHIILNMLMYVLPIFYTSFMYYITKTSGRLNNENNDDLG